MRLRSKFAIIYLGLWNMHTSATDELTFKPGHFMRAPVSLLGRDEET